jgi:hypothetical protein
MGRRTAAMLCVLLGHALLVLMLIDLTRPAGRRQIDPAEAFVTQLIPIYMPFDDRIPPMPDPEVRLAPPTAPGADAEAIGTSAANPPNSDSSEPGFVDWPKEGKDAAARVLAREAETERIAKMFAGPQGTWASLTKRQQSELNHFRWKPGVAGLERDEKGNTILHVSAGCTLVNFTMIACAIGKKPPAYGDLFKDMRLYFDEQRRPDTDEGNGREPESIRPPYWSKPLE